MKEFFFDFIGIYFVFSFAFQLVVYTFFYRKLSGLAFSLRFWAKIKQLLSNYPTSDWTFSFKIANFRVKLSNF